MDHLQIGDVSVQIINDGFWRTDGGAMFGVVPRTLWARKLEPDERNRVTLALRCLLIRSGGTTILVDTGLGDKLSERDHDIFAIERPIGLIGGLAHRGIAPEDVDLVVSTHLHLDHAGGNTTVRDGKTVPTFPRAEYWAQRREWDDATHPNERTRSTYLPENLQPLQESGRLHLFEDDREIAPGVRWLVSPGHTRSHTSILIESAGQSALFPVDVCPFVAHLERVAWVPAVDLEPLVSMDTKRRVVEDLLQHNRLIIFDHDPKVAVGRLVGSTDRWSVEPVGV